MDFILLEQSLFKDCAKETYYNNFSYEERRSWQSIEDLVKEKYYKFYVIQENNEFIGIITLWYFDTFVYVEHFAIRNSLQGKGYGTKIIQIIQKYNENIVLEIEKPITLIQKKRLNFYKRLKFIAFKDKYIQPPYHKNSIQVELLLMLYSKQETSKNNFIFIQHTLYKEVYKSY